jgi:hypothetical protein
MRRVLINHVNIKASHPDESPIFKIRQPEETHNFKIRQPAETPIFKHDVAETPIFQARQPVATPIFQREAAGSPIFADGKAALTRTRDYNVSKIATEVSKRMIYFSLVCSILPGVYGTASSPSFFSS